MEVKTIEDLSKYASDYAQYAYDCGFLGQNAKDPVEYLATKGIVLSPESSVYAKLVALGNASITEGNKAKNLRAKESTVKIPEFTKEDIAGLSSKDNTINQKSTKILASQQGYYSESGNNIIMNGGVSFDFKSMGFNQTPYEIENTILTISEEEKENSISIDLSKHNLTIPIYSRQTSLKISNAQKADGTYDLTTSFIDSKGNPAKPISLENDNGEEIDKFKVSSISLICGEDGKNISLNDRRNQFLFQHKEVLCAVIYEKPELLMTLPTVIFNLYQNDLLTSFQNGLSAQIKGKSSGEKSSYIKQMRISAETFIDKASSTRIDADHELLDAKALVKADYNRDSAVNKAITAAELGE